MEESVFPVEEGGMVLTVNMEDSKGTVEYKNDVRNPCPQCGEEIYVSGRCKFCGDCGWSTCMI